MCGPHSGKGASSLGLFLLLAFLSPSPCFGAGPQPSQAETLPTILADLSKGLTETHKGLKTLEQGLTEIRTGLTESSEESARLRAELIAQREALNKQVLDSQELSRQLKDSETTLRKISDDSLLWKCVSVGCALVALVAVVKAFSQ